MNRWSCTNNFIKKILTGAIFLLAPAANHACYRPIFNFNETAVCCYFGVDLGKELDHYSLSRLTDATPHSSSDLLYFTLLLPFTWTNYFESNSLSLFCFFGQTFCKSNFSSLFSLGKKILSPTSFPQKCSRTIPNSVLVAKSFQFRKQFLSPIFFLT